MNTQFPDCYGYLYDSYVTPCRNDCAARFLCRDKQSRNRENDPQEFLKEQRVAIAKMDALDE